MSEMFKNAMGLMRSPAAVEEEDEIPAPSEWAAEGRTCIACDDPLHYTEEIIKLSVDVVELQNGLPVSKPFFCTEGDFIGDFFYDPLFFEFACWEDAAESLRLMVEDAPPVKSHLELLKCDFCACSICEDEIYGSAHLGELHVSPRMPDTDGSGAKVASTFVSIAKPYIVCIGCLVLVDTHEVSLWDQDLNQLGECQECTHLRCWRYQGKCGCPCHEESRKDAQET